MKVHLFRLSRSARRFIWSRLPECIVTVFLLWILMAVLIASLYIQVKKDNKKTHENQQKIIQDVEKYYEKDSVYIQNIDSLNDAIENIK